MSNLTTSSAGRRILSLLDGNSFVEIGASVQARSTDFNAKPEDAPGDGIITGYGTIEGRLVYVYSQDADQLGGSVGEMHAKKIVSLYELARKTGYPIIGLLDSTGMRLTESTDALAAVGSIYKAMAECSGVIPQITAVFGNAGGGMAVLTELSDFVVMEAKSGKLFVHSPNAVKGNYEEKKDTASAEYKYTEAGVVDVCAEGDDAVAKIRELVSYLPDNCDGEAYLEESEDDLNRAAADMAAFSGDTVQAIIRLADDQVFFETKAGYAKHMVTGFIRLNGATVGVFANRSEITGEKKETFKNVLTIKGLKKAVKFVKFCDAFNIPILSLTNVSGFCNCEHAERSIATLAAQLTSALASASVPKVNVIVGEAYGSAAVVMNSKAIGADYVYAWKSAKVGAIDGKHAAEILYDGEDASVKSQKAAEYDALQASSVSAAARGYVDTLIDPADTRKYVVGAFEMLYGKDSMIPDKKHGTI